MKTIYYFMTCVALSLVISPVIKAQHGSATLNAAYDIRSAAMGHSALASEAMSIYGVPRLEAGKRWGRMTASYSFGFTGMKPIYHGRQLFQSLSVAYRESDKVLLLAGSRHWRGGRVELIAEDQSRRGFIYPQDWTLDLTYVYKFSSQLQHFGGVNYLNSYNSQTAHAFMLHLGLLHLGQLSSLRDGAYQFEASVHNWGSAIRYNKENTVSPLPTYLRGSALVSFIPFATHRLSLVLSTLYYTSVQEKEQTWQINSGLEYSVPNFVDLRAGFVYQTENPFVTLGLGRSFGKWQLNAAYNMGYYPDLNILNLGITYTL